MFKNLLFSIILFFLCSITVSAIDVNVTISPEHQSIKTNETAVFKLSINHNSNVNQLFEIFSSDVIWDLKTDQYLNVPNTGLITNLYIRPLNLNPGVYGVQIIIKSSNKEFFKKVIIIELNSPFEKNGSYLPAISGKIFLSNNLSNKIDPRNETFIILDVNNENFKSIPNLEIKLRSRIININTNTSLEPRGKKRLTFKVEFDKFTPPQRDQLKATLFAYDLDRQKDYQFDLLPVDYEVVEYGTDLVEDIKIKKSFLKTTKEIILSNDGNIPLIKEYKISKKGISYFFTSFDPKPKLSDDFYVWTIVLPIDASFKITELTNYWSLFLFILFVILVVVSYFIFRSPVVLKKSARILSTREGGISELKVIIHVKNRSSKKLRNVRIIDLIPSLAELLKHFDVGTLEPYKVVLHDAKGTIVKWKVDELEPGEERLIYYKIKNKLSVLSGISLPAAVAKFETAPETERSSKSNVVCLEF